MKAGFKRAGRALARLYPMGISLLWKAPLVLALAVVPELTQHVVEIQLGMFDSKAQASAVANDPTRWAFGYAKIAGVVLTFLAAARFWWARTHGGRWWDIRTVAWGRLVIGLLIFGGVPELASIFKARLDPVAFQIIIWSLTIVTLPMLFLLIAGVFGDRATPVAAIWRRSWPWLLLTALLVVLAFAPGQWLHGMNHKWASGAHPVIVWTLMIFDSLVVGLLAGLTGTAFYLGYAAFAGARDGRRRSSRSPLSV